MYDSVTSFLPPDQPNAQTTTTSAKAMFHAVTASCWPSEYAVALAGLVTCESEAVLTAWFTPMPPGVAETVFASELPPTIDITVWNVTGIAYAARKTAITPSFASQAPIDGSSTFRQ